MKVGMSIVLLVLVSGNVHAQDLRTCPTAALLSQTISADTSGNAALEEMLSRFEQTPEASALPYDSWTWTLHRYMGYAIVATSLTQVVLGSITWDARKAGREPSTKTAHKYLGYTTAGLSLAQSSLGYVNFWKMRGKDSGRTKRIVHLGLSTLATAGFVTAAVLAYNARQDIESGKAGRENKTFDDLYSNHRTVGVLSGASVLLTVIVIEW